MMQIRRQHWIIIWLSQTAGLNVTKYHTISLISRGTNFMTFEHNTVTLISIAMKTFRTEF